MTSFVHILARRLHASAPRGALSKLAMPAMSPTMTEGGISSWKKKEGESVAAGDVLVEVETDKATIDVEAQDDAILAKITVGDGSKNVKVGSIIAVLAESNDDLAGLDDFLKSLTQESPTPSPAATDTKPSDKKEAPAQPKSEPAEAAPSLPPSQPRETLAPGERVFASPVAKKLALERGVPLAKVRGTGPGGRIIREDVERYKAPAPTASSISGSSFPEYIDIPMSNMRRTIATRLTQSKQDVPHYYLTVDIHLDKLLKLREVFNKAMAADKDKAKGAAKLSINDFVIKAVACALADVPEANSHWLGETVRQYTKADISVAVSTANGLITPIVTDVGSKGLASISEEIKRLAQKARDGKLAPHEYQGGTFTVSNLGMYSISSFTAIINPPQSCILAVGTTVPTLVPAPEEERGFKTAHIMKVTLSSDHRVVDGAVGARWLAAFKGYMENPLTFML